MTLESLNFSKYVFVTSKVNIFRLWKGRPHSEFVPSFNSFSFFILSSTEVDSSATFARILLVSGISINTELWFSIVSWPWVCNSLFSKSKVDEMLMSLSKSGCSTSSKRMLKIWISIEISLLFNWSQTSTTVWLSSLFVTNSGVMVSRVIGSTNI